MADEDDTVQSCPEQEQEDKCAKLRKEIDELINRNKHDPSIPNSGRGRHGLVHRFRELISNLGKLQADPTIENIKNAQTHINEITKTQVDLANKLRELQENGCGDPPSGAWSWAERPTKEYQDQVDQAKQTLAGKSAAIAGAAVGVGYIAYRVVRMIPSLFPPLWETIPINLAIP